MAHTVTVKSGDTLSAIAKKAGVKVGDISGFRSGDPNLIFPGEVLTIGGQRAVSPRQPGFIGPVRPSPAPRSGQPGFIDPTRPPVSSTGTTPRQGQPIADFTRQFDLPQQEPARTPTITQPQPTPIPEPTTPVTPPPAVTGTSVLERFKDIQAEITAGQPKPFFTFGEEEQGQLRTALEEEAASDAELASILDAKLQIQEEFQQFGEGQVGLPEAGRQGAISEKGRELNRKLDVLNRRELVLEVKKRNRNNTINSLMQLGQQSFADATAQYNTSWNQAMQIISVFDKEEDELQINAKVSLAVRENAIKVQIEAGKLTFDQITGIQRAEIEDLEIQAGLPLGSTLAVLSSLREGEEKVYSGVDDNGTFTYITKSASGEFNIQKTLGVVAPTEISLPNSAKEYLFAGGEEGTGMTFQQWVGKASIAPIEGPLGDAFNSAMAFAGVGFTSAQREQIPIQFNQMIEAGNIEGAKEFLLRIAEEGASTSQGDRVQGRKEAIVALSDIQRRLNEYISSGGDTGVFTGKMEDIQRKIGRTSDPTLANLANSIRLAIVDYRRAVSGAAFTESEMQEYNRLFPNIGNVPELNQAIITSLVDTFSRNQDLFYRSIIGAQNYNSLFGLQTNVSLNADVLSTITEMSIVPGQEEIIIQQPTSFGLTQQDLIELGIK